MKPQEKQNRGKTKKPKNQKKIKNLWDYRNCAPQRRSDKNGIIGGEQSMGEGGGGSRPRRPRREEQDPILHAIA
jgi:hypothetical protein